jgi:hypothetical protein
VLASLLQGLSKYYLERNFEESLKAACYKINISQRAEEKLILGMASSVSEIIQGLSKIVYQVRDPTAQACNILYWKLKGRPRKGMPGEVKTLQLRGYEDK